MIFSVYDYDKRRFRYYDAVVGVPATGFFRKARTGSIKGSFTPESFAVLLPADAKPLGEGPLPKGYIAEDPRGLASAAVPGEVSSANTGTEGSKVPFWVVFVVGIAAYAMGRKNRAP